MAAIKRVRYNISANRRVNKALRICSDVLGYSKEDEKRLLEFENNVKRVRKFNICFGKPGDAFHLWLYGISAEAEVCTVVIEKFTEDGLLFISTNFTRSRTARQGFKELPGNRYFCGYQKLFELYNDSYKKEDEWKWDKIPLLAQNTSGAFGLDALNEILSNPTYHFTKLACLEQYFTERCQILKRSVKIGSYFRVLLGPQSIITRHNIDPRELYCDDEYGYPYINIEVRETPNENRDDYLVKIYVGPSVVAKLNLFKTLFSSELSEVLPYGIAREAGKSSNFTVGKAFFFIHPSEIITERPVLQLL